ncbi:probable glutamate receptor [Schistocerca americana]|uniref:probable glutamate receptor n=1 Tax=Schistocerca americana TaxID=7009 RepID=UPI001F4FF7C9|nr:probable glutamate receptor [Schistocerca americana]
MEATLARAADFVYGGSKRLDVHEVEDGEWGKQNPSGKWSGVVGELADGKVQLAVCSLIITTDRLDVIDFSTPVYETRESVFVRWPDPEGDGLQASVTRLGAVFQAEAWAAVGTALAASSICLCLLGRPRDAVLRAVAALCSQGMLVDAAGGDVGGGARRRVVVAVLATHLCGSCLLAAYSGRLTALQAVRRVSPPFRGLQGLLECPQYTLGLIRGSRLDALFSTTHDPTLRALHRTRMVNDHPLEYIKGFRRACQQRGFALLATKQVQGALADRLPCRLMEIPGAYFDGLAAFGFSKDFKYTAVFNYW